jgi:hypothetical protein
LIITQQRKAEGIAFCLIESALNSNSIHSSAHTTTGHIAAPVNSQPKGVAQLLQLLLLLINWVMGLGFSATAIAIT